MGLLIREASAADDFLVGELLVEAFVTAYAQKMPEVVVTEQRKRELRDVSSKREVAKVFVAEIDGQIVGTVSLFMPGSANSESWKKNYADLRHLAIDVKYQRGGSGGMGAAISKALLDRAEQVAKNLKADGICLHVRRGAHGVARLYMNRGFERDPLGDLEYPSVFLEGYFLKWTLPKTAQS